MVRVSEHYKILHIKKEDQNRTIANKKAMIEAMEKSLGIVTTACKNVGIERSTHYTWMANDPEYSKAIKDIDDIALDFSESNLHKRIQKGDTTAIIFHLKTKGKKRGYGDSNEIILKGLDGLTDQQLDEELRKLGS